MSNIAGYNSPSPSSFEGLTKEEIQTHYAIKQYGSFTLTGAVVPSYDVQVTPEEGYRIVSSRLNVPNLCAAASREKLFGLFVDLLDPFKNDLCITLVSSHKSGEIKKFTSENVDAIILKSHLYDYEDLLLNDGSTGISIYDPSMEYEIVWDEHKVIGVFGKNPDVFREILGHLLTFKKRMKFIFDAEHVHISSEHYSNRFQLMTNSLNCEQECR